MRLRLWLTCSVLALTLVNTACAAERPAVVPLTNAKFTTDVAGWRLEGLARQFSAAKVDGRSVLKLEVTEPQPPGWIQATQDLPVKPHQIIHARVEVRGENLHDGWGALLAMNFYAADGSRLAQVRSDICNRDNEWQTVSANAVVPETATRSELCLTLHGCGQAYFHAPQVTRTGVATLPPLKGPVMLTVTDETTCESLIGFGFEDDGWFYNDINQRHGVDDRAIALRERRIEWLDPDWIRMFMWYPDWCPTGDWKTFVFDSPNMLSKYRTLSLYQRLGAQVNITGVSWGMHRPLDDPQAFARAIGALFEHLIRERGFACIKSWTLANEPNAELHIHQGYSFEEYIRLHQLVRDEFRRRRLDVAIVGSDDADSLRWFTRCLQDPTYIELTDIFCSHRYFHAAEYGLVEPFFESRMSALAAKKPTKPFIVGEFGFLSEDWDSHKNAVMETYEYALLTSQFCITALNYGVAGTCIWVVQPMYYIDDRMMEFGLWEYVDEDWAIRPVYHATAMFTRLTETGDTARRVNSSAPRHLIGACVEDTLFWVNLADEPADVRIAGLPIKQVRIMTEDTLKGDRACGVVEPVRDGHFTAPPRSFGYATSTDE